MLIAACVTKCTFAGLNYTQQLRRRLLEQGLLSEAAVDKTEFIGIIFNENKNALILPQKTLHWRENDSGTFEWVEDSTITSLKVGDTLSQNSKIQLPDGTVLDGADDIVINAGGSIKTPAGTLYPSNFDFTANVVDGVDPTEMEATNGVASELDTMSFLTVDEENNLVNVTPSPEAEANTDFNGMGPSPNRLAQAEAPSPEDIFETAIGDKNFRDLLEANDVDINKLTEYLWSPETQENAVKDFDLKQFFLDNDVGGIVQTAAKDETSVYYDTARHWLDQIIPAPGNGEVAQINQGNQQLPENVVDYFNHDAVLNKLNEFYGVDTTNFPTFTLENYESLVPDFFPKDALQELKEIIPGMETLQFGNVEMPMPDIGFGGLENVVEDVTGALVEGVGN